MNSFYSELELQELKFKKIGKNVLISKKVSIYGSGNMEIGDNVRIDDFCILSGKIILNNNIHISAYVGLYGGTEGIYIDDYSSVSARTLIYAVTDDYSGNYMANPTIPNEYRNVTEEKVIVKKHSLIGAGSLILPGVVIEEGGAFGAMSLINSSTEEWSIYVGAPVRKIKARSKNILELEENYTKNICQ